MEHAKPAEILENTINIGIGKAGNSAINLLLLGVLAGAFIAFGAESSNMVASGLLLNGGTYGLGRCLAGFIFPTGLTLVILCGAELFTGNVLMVAGCVDGRIGVGGMLRNWALVYIGNFIGSVLMAWLMSQTGLFDAAGGAVGAITLKIGAGKANMAFWPAFVNGILCNWLVCLAVWIAFGSKTTFGKLIGLWTPIWVFVASGFEHSVANMYYVPAAIFAKQGLGSGAEAAAGYATMSGLAPEVIDNLTWGSFFLNNLIPVTLGNIVGGGLFVALIYWIVYRKKA